MTPTEIPPGQALGMPTGESCFRRRRLGSLLTGRVCGSPCGTAAFCIAAGGLALRGYVRAVVGCGVDAIRPRGPDVRLVRRILPAVWAQVFARICPGSIAAPSFQQIPNNQARSQQRQSVQAPGNADSKSGGPSRKLRMAGWDPVRIRCPRTGCSFPKARGATS